MTHKLGVKLMGGYQPPSETDRSGVATLDGQSQSGLGPLITIPSGAGTTTVVDGLTFIRTIGTSGYAIKTSYASPLIRGCTFPQDAGRYIVGGSNSSPHILGCLFQENVGTAASITLTGMDAAAPDAGEITGNTCVDNAYHAVYLANHQIPITHNSFMRTGDCASLTSGGMLEIAYNRFLGNRATDGAAIHCANAATIQNNLVMDNIATNRAGALRISTTKVTVLNNLFLGNSAERGGAIAVISGTPLIVNNTLAGNDDAGYGGAIYMDTASALDPIFTSRTYGNYHLRDTSPCKQYGLNSRAVGDTDLDGKPRILAGVINLGAYEMLMDVPYTPADIQKALKAAAGLTALNSTGYTFLNVATSGASQQRVALADVIAMLTVVLG